MIAVTRLTDEQTATPIGITTARSAAQLVPETSRLGVLFSAEFNGGEEFVRILIEMKG